MPPPVFEIASGTTLRGTGAPSATIAIDTDGDGRANYTTSVDGEGNWSITFDPALANGTAITVTQSDAAGNKSAATQVGLSATPPVALDLDGDGQISYTTANFDVDGDGDVDQTGWVAGNDGILLWDKYGDGQLHDNAQYVFADEGETDLEGLADKFDSNGDRLFDADDDNFLDFSVWSDDNQDGQVDADELISLVELGIVSLDIEGDGRLMEAADNVLVQGTTGAQLDDGTTMLAHDALFLVWHNSDEDGPLPVLEGDPHDSSHTAAEYAQTSTPLTPETGLIWHDVPDTV